MSKGKYIYRHSSQNERRSENIPISVDPSSAASSVRLPASRTKQFLKISTKNMSLPNSAEINAVAGNTSGDDADEDRGRDYAHWVHGRNSISSRVSLSSPRDSSGSATPSQFSHHSASASPASLTHGYFESKRTKKSKRKAWYKKKLTIGLVLLVGFFFLMNWWMLFRIQEPGRARGDIKVKSLETDDTTVFIRVGLELSACVCVRLLWLLCVRVWVSSWGEF